MNLILCMCLLLAHSWFLTDGIRSTAVLEEKVCCSLISLSLKGVGSEYVLNNLFKTPHQENMSV